MLANYTHNIDPIITSIAGVHLWWYGLGFTLGLLNAHLSIRRHARELALSPRSVYTLSLMLAGGVLIGGRLVEVLFYEWAFYRAHPAYIPALWLGGMATHGLLFGGIAGVALFCRLHRRSFLAVADSLAVAAAFILAMGRIGNFIDGQIVGSPADVAWAVKFPDADGFRHPVVLYDGLKNALLIPILLWVERRRPPVGVRIGLFLFLYAGLRVPIDVFREYPGTLLGLATGQSLNIFMALLGLGLVILRMRSRQRIAIGLESTGIPRAHDSGRVGWRRPLFLLILLLCPIIPSDWTQDIPARYGSRHPGLNHSTMYPAIDGQWLRSSPSAAIP